MCLGVDQSRSRDWQAMGLSPPHTARVAKRGLLSPWASVTLTLSASSGTRCCTRSNTYMLGCGRGLRRRQNRRNRKDLWLQYWCHQWRVGDSKTPGGGG